MVGTAYHSLDVPALSAGLFALRRSHEPQKLPVHQTGSTPIRVETVTVLTLAGGAYVEHGVFSRGEAATSPLLDGLTIAVTAMFDFAKG